VYLKTTVRDTGGRNRSISTNEVFWKLQQAEREREREREKLIITWCTLHNDVKLNVDTRYRRAQIVLIRSVYVTAATA